MPNDKCKDTEHKYVYGGVKFRLKNQHHTNARLRIYYDFFFCERCANTKLVELMYTDNTYSDLSYNATPIPTE